MEATFNLCNRLIDIGKSAIVERNIDLYLANNRLTEDEYSKLMERLHHTEKPAE